MFLRKIKILRLSLTLCFVLGLSMAGSLSLFADTANTNKKIAVMEKLINVGKWRLNFQIIKGSDVTILFEAGGGMDSTEWAKIMPEIARRTGATIITYDRPGFGKSDLPDTPLDMTEDTKWLFKGLEELGVDKDIILVGYSYGGWLIRLIGSMYPDKVLGMVFIDPFTTEFVDHFGIVYLDNHPMGGKLPFDTSKPEKLTKYQRALIRMVGKGLGPKVELMRRTSIPKGIPVHLISSGKLWLPKPEEQKVWRNTHEQMVAKIKGAKLVIAEKSNHMIPFQQPELIINSILDVFNQIKKERIKK